MPTVEPKARLGQQKTVNTLLPDDCRWPIGDPQVAGFHFCGKRKMNGPYCDAHMRQAFQPARARPVHYRPRDAA
jgi:GcrA cell cycle regulator